MLLLVPNPLAGKELLSDQTKPHTLFSGPANNSYFNLIIHPKRRLFEAVQRLVLQQMLWLLYDRMQRPTLSGNVAHLIQLLISSSLSRKQNSNLL